MIFFSVWFTLLSEVAFIFSLGSHVKFYEGSNFNGTEWSVAVPSASPELAWHDSGLCEESSIDVIHHTNTIAKEKARRVSENGSVSKQDALISRLDVGKGWIPANQDDGASAANNYLEIELQSAQRIGGVVLQAEKRGDSERGVSSISECLSRNGWDSSTGESQRANLNTQLSNYEGWAVAVLAALSDEQVLQLCPYFRKNVGRVDKFTAKYSVDGENWTDVEGGAELTAERPGLHTVVKVMTPATTAGTPSCKDCSHPGNFYRLLPNWPGKGAIQRGKDGLYYAIVEVKSTNNAYVSFLTKACLDLAGCTHLGCKTDKQVLYEVLLGLGVTGEQSGLAKSWCLPHMEAPGKYWNYREGRAVNNSWGELVVSRDPSSLSEKIAQNAATVTEANEQNFPDPSRFYKFWISFDPGTRRFATGKGMWVGKNEFMSFTDLPGTSSFDEPQDLGLLTTADAIGHFTIVHHYPKTATFGNEPVFAADRAPAAQDRFTANFPSGVVTAKYLRIFPKRNADSQKIAVRASLLIASARRTSCDVAATYNPTTKEFSLSDTGNNYVYGSIVSSVSVPKDAVLVAYTKKDYKGTRFSFREGNFNQANLGELKLDKKIESFQIFSNPGYLAQQGCPAFDFDESSNSIGNCPSGWTCGNLTKAVLTGKAVSVAARTSFSPSVRLATDEFVTQRQKTGSGKQFFRLGTDASVAWARSHKIRLSEKLAKIQLQMWNGGDQVYTPVKRRVNFSD